MGVRQRPSGRYQARLTVDGVPHSETFETHEEAEAWLAITRSRAASGPLPSAISVREYAARWMQTYETAPSTTAGWYRFHLDRHVLPAIGTCRIDQLTPTDMSLLINAVRSEVSAATADAVYRTLSAMLNAAVQDDVILRSPIRSKRHRPRRQKKPHVVLERPEAKRLLLHLMGWMRDAALLQLALGARFGEIAALTPHDIDLRRKTIQIQRRIAKGSVRATKNHRHRRLELPKATHAMIERLIRQAGDPDPIPDLKDREWPARPWRGCWLIQTRAGYPPNLSAYNKRLKELCPRLGIPTIASHGLRHTYVSWMIDDGHSADQVAFSIGDTAQTVREVYAHMLAASSQPAARTIDAALGDMS